MIEQADNEARELTDENYKTILNNMGDPVFVKDARSRLVLVNDAFCEIFGLPRLEIIGKTLAEDVAPDEREHFLKVDKQVLSDGIERIVEERLTVRGGETRIISTRKTRFIDETGNRFLVGVIRDVTELKQAEELERLNQYNEFLLEAAQILSQPRNKYQVSLQELAEKVAVYLDAVCDISILDNETALIKPEALYHEDEAVLRLINEIFKTAIVHRGQGLVGSVIESGKEVFINEVPEQMRGGPRKIDARIVPRSLMYVPLLGSQAVLGSLNITRLEGQDQFTEVEADQIRRLGEYVSLFVENGILKERQHLEVKLRSEAEKQLDAEKKWAEFKLEISSILANVEAGLSGILNLFAERVANQFDVVCDIQLADSETGSISPVAVFHKDQSITNEIKKLFDYSVLKIGEGMIGTVIQTGKELLVTSLPEDVLAKVKASNIDETVIPSSFVYVPLIGNTNVLGTLNLTRLSGQLTFSDTELTQVRDLAHHASRFIENRILQAQQKQEIQLRKRAEQKLERASKVLERMEAETRAILNAIPILIARVSSDYRYRFLNDAYHQLGADPRKLEGRHIEEFISTEGKTRLQPYFERVLNGEMVTYDYDGVIATGQHIYFNVVLAPDIDEKGEVVGFYSCAIDVTSKVLAERQAALTQERLESLSLNSGDAFFFHDEDQNIIDVNQVAVDMLGYSREELLNLKAHQIDPRWKGRNYQKFLAELEANAPQTFDTSIIHKDGFEIPIETRFVKRVEGGQVYIQSLLRDRTEKREQEIKLQRSEQRLRLIFENVEDYIATINEFGVFESINKVSHGHDEGDVVGSTIFDFYDNPDKKQYLNDKFETLKSEGGKFELEDTYTGPDGSKRTYSRKFIGIFHQQGFYKAILIIRDVTSERDREYSVMNAVLRGQEQERKRLGAELHDGIGQVLSAIALQVSQIREQAITSENERVSNDLNLLNTNLQEAVREVRNISHGLMPEVLENFGLKEAINQTCRHLSDRSGIKIKFDHVDLEPRYDPLVEMNLYRITQELLTNVQKHAQCKNVFVSLMDHGSSLNLTVEDDGVGFNPENDFKGIGLSNVYSRVGLMSGQIDVESDENSGTLINIDIPKL